MKTMQTIPDSIAKKFAGKFPVPVVSIARELGLKIYETDEFNDSKSGSIVKEGDDFFIYVNENHCPARKRFTIAHEIGHFLNDRELLESGKEIVDDLKRPVLNRSEDELSGDEKSREVCANHFAAELLMPKNEFQKKWSQSENTKLIADYFGVSESAAAIRGSNLFNSFMP